MAKQSLKQDAIDGAFEALVSSITQRHSETSNLVLAGIANGGIPVAEQLSELLENTLNRSIPLGTINITFERDDIGRKPPQSIDMPTTIPIDIEDAVVILVDDVIFSGRTIRAALNELFSLGRPASVELATLVDRGNRSLPIEPNHCGLQLTTAPDETVSVNLLPDNKSTIEVA